jgi:hypothetical protein
MWRVLVLASLLLVLALGTVAYADCTSCLTSAFIKPASSTSGITLNFTARSDEGTPLPNSVTAVVMQVDGQRTKCAGITLLKTSDVHGYAVYSGTFSAYGVYSHSGRVDLGGQIYEFTVPLDGKPGTIAIATDQTPLSRNRIVVQVTAAPTAAPTTAPARTTSFQLPTIEPTFLLGAAVVLVTIVGAFVDRRRAVARSLTA